MSSLEGPGEPNVIIHERGRGVRERDVMMEAKVRERGRNLKKL